MSIEAPTDRRRLLARVKAELEDALKPDLAATGFRLTKRYSLFRRERDGVVSVFGLGMASRPPSIGRLGILVEPTLTTSVPAWAAEADRRLDGQTDRWLVREGRGGTATFELLDWLVPGKAPHWTLPDEPSRQSIDGIADGLRDAIRNVVLPRFASLRTPEFILAAAAAGEIRVMDASRFTIACGALLLGEPGLAASVIAPIGTSRRLSLANALGLPAEPK